MEGGEATGTTCDTDEAIKAAEVVDGATGPEVKAGGETGAGGASGYVCTEGGEEGGPGGAGVGEDNGGVAG